nr:UPF0149 family protein [Sphingomonas sp. CFBP 8764]
MLLTELDGFLTGLLISPEAIAPGEWMTVIWGSESDRTPPFEDPLDVQWFADAVAARRDEMRATLPAASFSRSSTSMSATVKFCGNIGSTA